VVSSTPRLHFTSGKDPVPILQEAGWAPGPVWTGGRSRPSRDSIPDRSASSPVAIPTELPGPPFLHNNLGNNKGSSVLSDARIFKYLSSPPPRHFLLRLYVFHITRSWNAFSVYPCVNVTHKFYTYEKQPETSSSVWYNLYASR